eukprot:20426-Heterococcus_DN1.PRE.2
MMLAFAYAVCKYDIVLLTIINVFNLFIYCILLVPGFFLKGKHSPGHTVVMGDHSRVYEPEHAGIDASSMMKALQTVAQQGWIPPTTLSLSTATHTHWLHSTAIKFHVAKQVCDAVVSGISKRPMVTHLSIDQIVCENRTVQQFQLLSGIITGLPQLQTLTINNTRHTSAIMNVKIDQLLGMVPKTCTAVNLMYTYRAKYSDALVAHTIPDHIKVLTARNVQLVLTPDSQLTKLHIERCRKSNRLQLPTTLQELCVANSIRLPVLPQKLSVLDLSKSAITRGLSGLIPDTVQTLKLSDYYTDTIGTLPVALVYLDLGYMYTQPIERLPSTLKHFSLKRKANDDIGLYEHSLDGILPDGLQVLHISSLAHSLGVLPRELQELYYECSVHSLGVLPRSLRVLQIDSMGFNSSLGQLPESLTEVDISKAYAFTKPLGTLPVTLKKLYIHMDYDQHILATTSSTLVCIRQPIDNQDILHMDDLDFGFNEFGDIAAVEAPYFAFLAQMDLEEDVYGASDIDTDSDDDDECMNDDYYTFTWRSSFPTNTDALYLPN